MNKRIDLVALVRERLKHKLDELRDGGQLPTIETLQRYYSTFREHFGPERLQRIDGEELLNTMHAHGSRDSLVYWLEFKNDEEFPDLFGSIAGGSALKFGIYRRQEDGQWMTGASTDQQMISVADAIEIARTHRNELIAASRVLQNFDGDASDDAYARLQADIARVAPTVSDSAWGHKYLSLLFPTKLDDYHVDEFQRFYLIKMLQNPPPTAGRYAAAGRYVMAANALDAPMNHLTTALKSLFGRPARVWRIGTKLGGHDSIWQMMQRDSCIAIGWASVGDLSKLPAGSDGRKVVREKLEATGHASQNTNQIFNFVRRISEGDEVLAADGQQILGIGKVTGPYVYDPQGSSDAPHRRAVEWLDVEPWELPKTEGLRSTVRELKRFPENLVAIERRLFQAPHPAARERVSTRETAILRVLEGIPARIESILARKGQAILYGPPGTGKTYWAQLAALQLAARSVHRQDFQDLDEASRAKLEGSSGNVRRCTFHPAYGYEDFIEGYRPSSAVSGTLTFELRDGIFKRLCRVAEKDPGRRYYLLIDEINRGDISRIFGELITLLELDKREIPVELPLSRELFAVPRNVFIIGTMNTADRSIALLDTALRRRFGFIELMPDPEMLKGASVANVPLGRWLSGLNERIRRNVSRDARNLQIGHAYFLEDGKPVSDLARFSQILSEDVIPLVEEYCYEDFRALCAVLGSGFVDESAQRIRTELFAPDRRDELVKALLAPWPELATSKQAIDAAEEGADLEKAEGDETEDDAR